MTVESKCVKEMAGKEGTESFYAEYPVFIQNDFRPPADLKAKDKKGYSSQAAINSCEKLNAATKRFIKAACRPGKGADSTSITYKLYNCDEDFVSFTIDVQRLKGKALLYIHRFCFNWDCRAAALIPLSVFTRRHKSLRKTTGKAIGYTFSPGTLYVHKSSFTPEKGQNCRRSQYKRFLTAVPYDLQPLQISERQDFLLSLFLC